MNLEQVAATSFLAELAKIAACSRVEGEKTAAVGLLEKLAAENVLEFLKQAGFGSMLAGVGRGVGALGMGAMKGLGGMAAGAARGVGGAISNAAGSAAGALKAAPGAIGSKMTALGQRAEAGLSGMGQRLQAAGQAKGQAIQGRLAGPNASGAMNDIAMHQQANAAPAMPHPENQKTQALTQIEGNRMDAAKGKLAPAPAAAPAYKPPMMSMRQQLGESNPFQGMGSSLVSGVRGMLQRPPTAQPAAPARAPAAYGTLAPAM